MKFINTRNKKKYSFLKILLKGISKKGGLFMPEKFPKVNLKKIIKKNYKELFSYIFKKYLSKEEINFLNIKKIIKKTFNKKNFFSVKKIVDFKKIKLFKNKILLYKIYNGKTGSFKDMAISFLTNLISVYLKKKKKKINLVTSTSGDTGSSCAFFARKEKNIKIFILSPFKKISNFQANQMFSIKKKNLFNIKINGNFDDCQNILKKYILKKEKFSTLNSINLVRIISQSVYYFFCYKMFKKPLIFSIPTGNFGNAYSAFLAYKMGMPIKKIILCNNENDMCFSFFENKKQINKKVVKTNSPSMDILKPSNLERYLYEVLKKKDYIKYIKNIPFKYHKKSIFKATRCTKKERKRVIKEIYKKNKKLIIDTHTANALIYLKKKKCNNFICVSTASYVKFTKSIFNILNIKKKIKIIEKLKKKRKKTYKFNSKDKSKILNFIKINKN